MTKIRWTDAYTAIRTATDERGFPRWKDLVATSHRQWFLFPDFS